MVVQEQVQRPPQTRQQRFMAAAAGHVQAIRAEEPDYGHWQTYKTIYGGLCHKLPILVMTDGLAQTVALIEAKAKAAPDAPPPAKARERAYWRLRQHLAATLGEPAGGVAQFVRTAGVGEYIHATRTVLAAWVYYKRFAESILDVGADADTQKGD